MPKFLSFLFVLLLTLFPLAQTTLADAPACMNKDVPSGGAPAVGIDYTLNPPTIFEGSTSLEIRFKNLPAGTYQLRVQDPSPWTYFGTSYTQVNETVFTIGTIEGKLDNGKHLATLLKWNTSSNRYDEFCGWVNYYVGFSNASCTATLNPPNPAVNQPIFVNISKAPQGGGGGKPAHMIFLNGANTGKTVTVDPYGNGFFPLDSYNTPKNGEYVEIGQPGVHFCKTTFDVTPLSTGGSGTTGGGTTGGSTGGTTGGTTPGTTPSGSFCVISPTTPLDTSDVYLVVANATPDTTLNAELITSAGTETIPKKTDSKGIANIQLNTGGRKLAVGNYVVKVSEGSNDLCGNVNFKVTDLATYGSGIILATTGVSGSALSGAGVPCAGSGIETAIGCVPTEPVALVNGLFKVSIGISGAVALLMMIVGAFQMLTSAGNPDPLKQGTERLTNAIVGLLFIVFSALLLQIIGVDILGIPGFKP